MLNDRMLIWILEYVFGGTLVVVPLTNRVLCPPAWTDAHKWATQLFVVSLGVILISCASSMRQRFRPKVTIALLHQVVDHNLYRFHGGNPVVSCLFGYPTDFDIPRRDKRWSRR